MIHGLAHKLRDPEWIRKEFWQMFRYGIVGGTSTLLFLGLYALFSRVIWPHANPTLLDAVALTISAVFNFTLHRIWSFKANGFNFGMIRRYIMTIIISSVVQVALFHVGTAWLGVRDFYIQIALVPFIAFLQYVAHRMFTFHRRFERNAGESPSHQAIEPSNEDQFNLQRDA